jgi:GTP pyrophosphokinase
MLDTERFARVVTFAARAHAGQRRKSTLIPYITHPLAVSALVVEFGGDEDQAIAGLLHDVVEDCDVSLLTISAEFGLRVASIVEGCTDGVIDADGRKAPWLERKIRYLEHLEDEAADVLLVSACDKLHNARAIVDDIRTIGEAVFERFTANRQQTIWYYRRLAGIFARRLRDPHLVRALEYEVANMTDYGAPSDASAL